MISYKDLPDSARVWVYQSTREFTPEQVEVIRHALEEFVDHWTAHGERLKAAGEVFFNRFVVLFADEQQARASGCSIDASVGFIRRLQQELETSMLDWRTVVYRDGDTTVSCTRSEFEQKIRSGKVGSHTVVYNNFVADKGDFESNWEVPLYQSKYSHFLQVEQAP